MTIELDQPTIAELADVVSVLREWQHNAAPVQLHPGDIGWFWLRGAEATAAAVRTWRQDGRILAVGLLDGPGLVRWTSAPGTQRDELLARQVAADLSDPIRDVLPAGKAVVEAPVGAILPELLSADGWHIDEPWTPLSRDLSTPVEDPGVHIETVGPEQVSAHTAVHRSAFGSAGFTDEHWQTMATGLPFTDARSLIARDEQGTAVAMATVWSAGPGRPGLLEPVGAHADHRGRGYGRAISVAAAAALQQLGSSSAVVCTESSNVSAVAAYRSAGFTPQPERRDRYRDA